jgi:hypothetical protein
MTHRYLSFVAVAILTTACSLPPGPQGERGPAGAPGMPGATGKSGAPGKDGQGYVDGTRLTARYLLGRDGSRQFFAWHDTDPTIDADCVFVEGSDTAIRCLPGTKGGLVLVYETGCDVLLGLGVEPGKVVSPLPGFVYFVGVVGSAGPGTLDAIYHVGPALVPAPAGAVTCPFGAPFDAAVYQATLVDPASLVSATPQ